MSCTIVYLYQFNSYGFGRILDYIFNLLLDQECYNINNNCEINENFEMYIYIVCNLIYNVSNYFAMRVYIIN